MPDQTPLDVEVMRRRIDAFTGSDHYRFTIDGIEYDAHWAHDTRRLLDENARLNAENDDMRKRVAFAAAVISGDAAEMLAESLKKVRSDLAARDRTVEALSARLTAKNAELDKVIREAAADKAKLAAVRVEPPELAAIRERVDRDFVTDPGSVSGELAAELMQARIDRRALLASFDAELAEHAKPASEMPRPPAEELAAKLAEIQSDLDALESRRDAPPETGREYLQRMGAEFRSNMARLKARDEADVERDRLAAQERAGDADTSPAGSGRGTSVAEASGTAQAREEWGVRRRDGRVLSFEDRDDAEAFADGWHGGERTVVHRFIGPWEPAPSLPVPSTEGQR